MPTLTTADGRTLAWRQFGEGPVLVCHSGGPGVPASYFGEMPELSRRRSLVVLDPRGTGGSDRPQDPSAYGLEDYAADLEQLREHLGLDRMDVFGHSHGGFVAIVWAAANPQSVDRLVLANTLVRFSGETGAAIEAMMMARASEPWYEDALAARESRLEGEGRFASDEELGTLFARELPFYFTRFGEEEAAFAAEIGRAGRNGDAMRTFNSEIAPSFDLRPDLGRIERPALVITGELDFVATPAAAQETAAGLPSARLVVLPGAAHFGFAESGSRAAFTEAVLDFLHSSSKAEPGA